MAGSERGDRHDMATILQVKNDGLSYSVLHNFALLPNQSEQPPQKQLSKERIMKKPLALWVASAGVCLLAYQPAQASLTAVSSGGLLPTQEAPALSLSNFDGTLGVQSSIPTWDDESPSGTLPTRRPNVTGVFNVPVNGTSSEVGPSGEVIREVDATPPPPVPEPTTMIAGALLLLPFAVALLRNSRKSVTS